LLLAEQQRNDGKFAEANATLQRFISENPKHELISTAWMAIAANLESMGKVDDALATYQRLATSDAHSFNAPLAMLAQVRLLKEKKQNDEARKVCETILTQYRDSFAASDASRQLRLLKPAAPPTPPQPQQASAPQQQAQPVAPKAINIAPPPAAAPQPTGPTGPPPKKP
jgi:tetratricopeptide (TPR) repeat protein